MYLPNSAGIITLRRSPSHILVIARSIPEMTSLAPNLKINGEFREKLESTKVPSAKFKE